MSASEETIRIRRGEKDGQLCTMFCDKLDSFVQAMPEYQMLKGPLPDSKDAQNARPLTLPEGSIFIYAERGPENNPVMMGSICLVPLHTGTRNFNGLPFELEKVGEIKRMVVLDGYRRKGVAGKLIEAIEEFARDEMKVKHVVVETLWALPAAQSMYEKHGFRQIEVWGGYIPDDSKGYGKWL